MIDRDLDPIARGDEDHYTKEDYRADNADDLRDQHREAQQEEDLRFIERLLRNKFDEPDGDDPIGAHQRRVHIMHLCKRVGFIEAAKEMESDLNVSSSTPQTHGN